MDNLTVLSEDERVNLELWRAFVGSRADTRVNSNFATRCRELASTKNPDCGFVERAVQDFERLQKVGGSELKSEKLNLLVATADRIDRNLLSLDAVDTDCPVLYSIKVQEMYLMLYSFCKRFPSTVLDGWYNDGHFTGPWLCKVESLAQISGQGLYAAFNVIRDVILSFPENNNRSGEPDGNVMFSSSVWLANRFLMTMIRVFLDLYSEDSRYVEGQPLLQLRRCLSDGIQTPSLSLLRKCKDLLLDIRSISRAKVTSLVISHKIPFDIAEIIKPYLLEHPRLREKTVEYIYRTTPQPQKPQYCCMTRDQIDHYKQDKHILEQSELDFRQLTCLDHSYPGQWNTDVRGYEHVHLFYFSDLTLLTRPLCKYAWGDCTGHFNDNTWLLWPAQILKDSKADTRDQGMI